MMLFGLPFLIIGIALFFYSLLLYPQAASVPDGGNALVTTAFSLPFGGIGAFLVFGPLVEARTAHRDIRYALTTRAAYVIRQGRFPGLKVYPILPIPRWNWNPARAPARSGCIPGRNATRTAILAPRKRALKTSPRLRKCSP